MDSVVILDPRLVPSGFIYSSSTSNKSPIKLFKISPFVARKLISTVMAFKAPLQGTLSRNDAYAWSKQTVLRIEALSDQQVFLALQSTMEGKGYSWHSINELLQDRLDQGHLEFTFVDGDVLFEWNNLCDEKRVWERKGGLSHHCAEFHRDCLINLMILPFQGGLGFEGRFSQEFDWSNNI